MTGQAVIRRPKIIVIADDLSGAAELAGIAFARGLSAEVQRQYEPASDAQLIAIDADSRNLDAISAADRVRKLIEQVLANKPAWIFKKVDSVLRGNPRAEIEAILQTTGQRRALLVPANPTRGREIIGGQILIDGVPLDQTQFARDPDQPRQSADVMRLLGDGRHPLHSIRTDSPLPAEGIVVPDIEHPAELERMTGLTSDETLLAGAADFFAALLEARPTTPARSIMPPVQIFPPALVVCGSRASWPTRRQQFAAAGLPIITIDAGFGTGPRQFGSLLLGIGDSELAVTDTIWLLFLSKLAGSIIQDCAVSTILIEGGATAAAIAEHFDWSRFALEATAPAGVGVLRPLALGAPLVLIKPGSYAWPSDIWQAVVRYGVG